MLRRLSSHVRAMARAALGHRNHRRDRTRCRALECDPDRERPQHMIGLRRSFAVLLSCRRALWSTVFLIASIAVLSLRRSACQGLHAQVRLDRSEPHRDGQVRQRITIELASTP
jgi:hypothetical protein